VTKDFDQMLILMQHSFQDLENGLVYSPEFVDLSYGKAFRYKEKNIHQALILKLARAQSAVRASRVLLNNGFVQEQSMLSRVIDETNEDIAFLVYAVTNDTLTPLHQQYLDYFWEEEIDESGNMIDSKQKRGMTSRKKIRAYLSKIEGNVLDPSKSIELSRTLNKTYSGFVHGAAPQIMDLYVGKPPHFHINGMLGTIRIEENTNDLWNYMYRTLISHALVAKAFGAEDIVKQLLECIKAFDSNEDMVASKIT